MNQIMIYDPRIADKVHEHLTDGMINAVNQNHKRAVFVETVGNTFAVLHQAQLRANRAKATESQAHWKRNERIVTTVVAPATATGVLLGLAPFGAIAGWVAHIAIAAGSVAAFYKIREAL